ncbi:retrovirus-related pol polyprotein from transposon TNT 1-94 [Tanacetum coccineum]
MSTSNTHQQSLVDAGSETRPSMLERGSCIPWASRFRRYLNRKRDNRKWLNKAIDEGPCEFRIFTPSDTEAPRMQKEEDLRGDDLKHYEVEIEAMNLILISIPSDIYNSVDACTTAKAIWQRKLANASRANKVEKSHDPLALVAHKGSSSRTTTPYYVTHPYSVVDYDEDYQGDAVQNNSKDPLTSAMILLALAITQRFSNPTNNRLRTSSNTRNQGIVQGDRVNIQSRNSGNDGRNTRRSYVQEEIIEGNNVQNDAGNIQRTLRTTSSGTVANVQCYNCSEKGHYARNCPKPRNDFLFVDASRMEEIEELSANICLMARIQPANIDSDVGPSYDYAFLSEVQTPSTSYVNPLFAKDNQEQKYLNQPKTINNTIGDDQIDNNIIFDEPNGDVNCSSVENDNNAQASYELEQLARVAYKEAEKQQIIAKKVQQQNTVLTKQLKSYKEKVRVFEKTKGNNTTYSNENIKADRKAKQFKQESQSQFIHDQDTIRDLEQQRDNLDLSIVELKGQIMELQKTQTILKQRMSENEDKYHDTVLDLEAKAKNNVDVVLKLVIIMAQPQRQANVHQDELCPPNKRYVLMDANKKIDLDNPMYPNESKIMANIIQNHPLRFNIAASSSVPLIYLGQFWHTLQEDGSKYRLKFVLDRKEITMNLNDFRRIFQLPQATDNNHEQFVAAPKFSEMVPFFLNTLGFTLELRSPSNFKTTGLVQPWQTLGKIFSRCLTTRVTSHDQPPLQIMQMLYCFVNNMHVDYAELLWEGLHYALEHPSTQIPYPRFTKLIVGCYMTASPEIS